MSSFVTNGYL
ncbi:RNA polymerase subunit RPO18, partial [Monkeypox virus]